MRMEDHKIEILAPAGDFDTLIAAEEAGCDAVYLGGERFGARAFATNFHQEELMKAIDYMHLRGKRLYLTVNTLIKEKELPDLYEYLSPLYEHGLDAVIVQDIGVMDYLLRQFPGLDIHMSTQMTVTNATSAKYLESLGAVRVVPARELSLEEIRKIREETNLEIECFVHGALCYCYSGQCLMSSLIGGRSGNRGQCAQPCRLPYRVNGDKKAVDLLSLKDLSTIQLIPQLIEAGIDSFKIEGRMKRPEYVATVVSLYRKYVDLYLMNTSGKFEVSEDDVTLLQCAYQRRGYTDGYYRRHNGPQMLSLKRPDQSDKSVLPVLKKKKEKLNGKLTLYPGKNVTLCIDYGDLSITVEGDPAEVASKQPLAKERVEKQLRKTGDTAFEFQTLEIDMGDSVFVPMQVLNTVRRNGIEQIENALVLKYRRVPVDFVQVKERVNNDRRELGLNISVEKMEQLVAVSEYYFWNRIYIEDQLWIDQKTRSKLDRIVRELKGRGVEVYFAMARIYRMEAEHMYTMFLEEMSKLSDGFLVRSIDEYLILTEDGLTDKIITDSNLYQWNHYAVDWWKSRRTIGYTVPVELNRYEMEQLDLSRAELGIYGYQPVMISAGCVKKNTDRCRHTSEETVVTDRQNHKMIVKNECIYCYNVIYNSAPLYLLDQKDMIENLGLAGVRVQFTVESEELTREIMSQFEESFVNGMNIATPKGEFTRGHYKRGVK